MVRKECALFFQQRCCSALFHQDGSDSFSQENANSFCMLSYTRATHSWTCRWDLYEGDGNFPNRLVELRKVSFDCKDAKRCRYALEGVVQEATGDAANDMLIAEEMDNVATGEPGTPAQRPSSVIILETDTASCTADVGGMLKRPDRLKHDVPDRHIKEKSERSIADKGADLQDIWRRAESAVLEAAQNRGREANAMKAMHDYLQALLKSTLTESSKEEGFALAMTQMSKVRDWDKPAWFKNDAPTWRDVAGRRVTEHEYIRLRNSLTEEQMEKWDTWAQLYGKQFVDQAGAIDSRIVAWDDYLVRRVSIDSVKNWMRRRPEETFINEMFAMLAENKCYVGGTHLRIKAAKDSTGQIRLVENRNGVLFFEGSEDLVPLAEDERGMFIEIPNDADMIVFERRTVNHESQIVPMAQPNSRDPNIQWFNGAAVKRGWAKESRIVRGPEAFATEELYGFFPDHFPMRVTNSVEGGKPTPKVGAAIYGYARDHAGRQARHLIVEFGDVMPNLKRNNSQLINDARILFGLQKSNT